MNTSTTLDLLALARQHTTLTDRPVATTKGGEYKGPCPLCGGEDRLAVWPNHPSGRGEWWCKGCEKQGDAIALLVELGEITPQEAGRLRRGERAQLRTPAQPQQPAPPRRPQLAAPDQEWQQAARAFVAGCDAALWSDIGSRALAWLQGRGLEDSTIRAAGLGYNAEDGRQPREAWGLDGDRPIWLPRGIVIPWEIDEGLWRVNIRRPKGSPKYIGPAGGANGLYNAGALATDKAAILVEGEIDALTLGQVAGDLVVPVATGSTSGARRPRWIARLALCPLVLVSFDAEEDKGDKAAAWWVDVLPNGNRWRPLWADANAMAQDGADLRAWVLAALDGGEPEPENVSNWRQSPAENVRQGAQIPPWAAQRMIIDDVPAFRARWGLRTEGGGWLEGADCPHLVMTEA